MTKEEAIQQLEGTPDTEQVRMEVSTVDGKLLYKVINFPRILIRDIKKEKGKRYLIIT